jgi:hypothetical protein
VTNTRRFSGTLGKRSNVVSLKMVIGNVQTSGNLDVDRRRRRGRTPKN